jgi:hypothetical protein
MKTKLSIALLSVFLIVVSVSAQVKTSELLGTWKLVSHKYGGSDIQYANDSIVQRIKLITPTTFTWVHFNTKDQLVREVAGGTYVFDGDNYIESIDFGGASMQSFLNKKQAFKIKIQDGQLYQFGVLTNGLPIEEVWKKIEAK